MPSGAEVPNQQVSPHLLSTIKSNNKTLPCGINQSSQQNLNNNFNKVFTMGHYYGYKFANMIQPVTQCISPFLAMTKFTRNNCAVLLETTQCLRACFETPASAGRARHTAARNRSAHEVDEELLAPSVGPAPEGDSLLLFKIVPDDFVEPAVNAAMASAAGFKTCSQGRQEHIHYSPSMKFLTSG
jgi:hypothetical protein